MPSLQSKEQEFMSLAPDIAVIPDEFRNLAYNKLDFEPGEGGLGNSVAEGQRASSGGDTMDAFLAGVAAGADPKDLAKELRSSSKPTRRRAA